MNQITKKQSKSTKIFHRLGLSALFLSLMVFISFNLPAHHATSALYDFETIELKTSAQLALNIQNTENTSDTFSWSLHYTNTQCNQVFVEGQMQEDESDCYSQTSVFRTLNENTPNFSRSYSVVLNTEAQFTYSVNGSDPITELIQINNPNTVYNVEY